MEPLQPVQHSNIFMSKQEVRLELFTLLDWSVGSLPTRLLVGLGGEYVLK